MEKGLAVKLTQLTNIFMSTNMSAKGGSATGGKKFVFVYYGRVRAEDFNNEEMKAVMDKWMAWFGTFQDKMIDGGNPFGPLVKAVTAKGVETIAVDTLPAKGYTIINAKDMDEAVSIAKGCPAVIDEDGGAVHVYEALPM